MMVRPASAFKYRDGVAANLAALGYATLGHALAVGLLLAGTWPLRLAGVLLAAHTLAAATYLMHECMHETIFRDRRWNARCGAALAWLAGGAPAGYERLRRKHLHHHFDRIDPLAFDYRAFLAAHRRTRRAVMALEWLHVPAVELLLRAAPLARACSDPTWRTERPRVAAAVASRLLCATALLMVSPAALGLYGVAYLLFVVGVRFGDAFHHTFDVVLVPDYGLDFGPPPGKDRAYEHANTYSNVLSLRWPALNLLVLNFAYHNAHHVKPGIPWHRLPALDAKLFGGDRRQVLPLRRLLADFHAFRLDRLAGDQAHGAVAVSLLTV